MSRAIEPAYRLKERCLRGEANADTHRKEFASARESLAHAPIEKLFRACARRIRSKGELGELSALNQKLWLQYRELHQFIGLAQTNVPAANPAGR